MDRIYHLYQVNLLHEEKITFTWQHAIKIKVYNCYIVPAGMGRDSLSELIWVQTRHTKKSVYEVKSAGSTTYFCHFCHLFCGLSSLAPVLCRWEWAPLPVLM